MCNYPVAAPCRVCLVCVGQEGERNDLALGFLGAAVPMLEGIGLEVLGGRDAVAVTPGEIVSAVRAGLDGGCDVLLCLVGTWVLADKVIDAVRGLFVPMALWGIPEGTSFSSVGANVLHGAMDELGMAHTLFYGQPGDPTLAAELAAFARAAHAVGRLRRARLGLLGGRSISAYPTAADPNQIKAVFGTEVVHIDQLVLLERARALPQSRVNEAAVTFRAHWSAPDAPAAVVEKSLRVYLALQEIKAEYGLDLLTVKCLEEFIGTYISCCTAVGLLNGEGIVTTCQCDLNAALSMYLLESLSGAPAIFGDVNTVDIDAGVARMINCGSMAVTLAGREGVRWLEQYEYMGAGGGLCPVFCCKEGPVTFGTLGRVKGLYVLLIASGQAYEEPFETYRDVRTWPQGFIRLNADPRAFYGCLRSNHSVVGYGDIRRELRYAAQLLGVSTVEP